MHEVELPLSLVPAFASCPLCSAGMADLESKMAALEQELQAKQAALGAASQHSMLRQAYDRQLRELQASLGRAHLCLSLPVERLPRLLPWQMLVHCSCLTWQAVCLTVQSTVQHNQSCCNLRPLLTSLCACCPAA